MYTKDYCSGPNLKFKLLNLLVLVVLNNKRHKSIPSGTIKTIVQIFKHRKIIIQILIIRAN